jgi:hypothetical protein
VDEAQDQANQLVVDLFSYLWGATNKPEPTQSPNTTACSPVIEHTSLLSMLERGIYVIRRPVFNQSSVV